MTKARLWTIATASSMIVLSCIFYVIEQPIAGTGVFIIAYLILVAPGGECLDVFYLTRDTLLNIAYWTFYVIGFERHDGSGLPIGTLATIGSGIYVVSRALWVVLRQRGLPVRILPWFIALTFSYLLQFFTLVYYTNGLGGHFTEPLTKVEAFYFTVTTMTTTFGDITPQTDIMRMVIAVQLLLGLVFFGVVVVLTVNVMGNRPRVVPHGDQEAAGP